MSLHQQAGSLTLALSNLQSTCHNLFGQLIIDEHLEFIFTVHNNIYISVIAILKTTESRITELNCTLNYEFWDRPSKCFSESFKIKYILKNALKCSFNYNLCNIQQKKLYFSLQTHRENAIKLFQSDFIELMIWKILKFHLLFYNFFRPIPENKCLNLVLLIYILLLLNKLVHLVLIFK